MMRLPDTQNANYLYAFKKGYRAATEGKKLTSMPGTVRRDDVMRGYFMQGWEQAQDEMSTPVQSEQGNNPWKYRAIWTSITLLAGVLTAALIIKDVNKDKVPENASSAAELKTQALTELPPPSINQPAQSAQESSSITPAPLEESLPVQTEPATPPESSETVEPAPSPVSESEEEKTASSLSLLSSEARKDAELNRQEFAETQAGKTDLPPIVASPIKVKAAVLTTDIRGHEPTEHFDNQVPKYVRSLKFFTNLKVDRPQTIYHRWRYQDRIMATIALNIQPGGFRTWSSKNFTSAWQGQWYVEVLNEKRQVVYRKAFTYGAQ
ncbi:DUF2914 domain-containing protein [Thiomicrorhabdus heinhorstiae]|uniref:DUF2914 domain-containing protein n=1 Tax=Thiomicrorhabdus heinhorstiae TaxID=2748010 RepID=A0ABS0BUX8_9GAMM|nr:DUF2914 domain-containing protein [Thiomicrorhabdus heinhorstiae]MBF6057580.1 DUF2914 domain-containing protein [Thiomicrorhabdus heinhorstiae]